MKILVTGGASGLGKSITLALLSNNDNNVLFTYHRSKISSEEILYRYPKAKGIQCDFTKKDDIENLKKIMEDENIECLVNNAYQILFKEKHFNKCNLVINAESFKANIIPVLELTQKAISIFRKRKFGKIITILSSAIIDRPPIGWSLYVAEKNYLLSMVKSWAIENGKYNISSNAISPMFMLTNFHKDKDPRIVEQIKEAQQDGRFLQPIEVAKVVKMLIGSTQKINGHNLIINAAEHVI